MFGNDPHPLREYIDELAETLPVVAAKLRTRIDLLAAEGTLSKSIECRHMGQGLWELKVRSKVGTHRIVFGILEGMVLLLHAFTKKSKKTPKFELETARRRLKEVER